MMPTFAISILLANMLFLVVFWLRRRKEMISIRLRYSLYRLRDELRYSVVTEEAPNDEVFSRLDNRLSVLIDREPFVTPWNVFRLNEARLKQLDRYIENEKAFESTLKAPEYKSVLRIYELHKQPLSDHIAKKFWGFTLFIYILAYISLFLNRFIKRSKESEWLQTVSHRAKDARTISEHPVLLEYQCCSI